MLKKIRTLIVDDSLLIRNVLSDLISAQPDFEVVGTAHNGNSALQKVKELNPDVITLDVEMPVMNGIECLRHIMKEKPTPVIMVSSITYEGGFKTLQALEAGAFDFIQKPRAQASSSLEKVAEDLIKKLRQAVASPFIKKFQKDTKTTFKAVPSSITPSRTSSAQNISPKLAKIVKDKDFVIAIGISTGGPPCLNKIFEAMPKNSPPILVVQHMPENFTKAMADRIDKVSQMNVKEAEEGDIITPGTGYIAPGHSHITINKFGFKKQIHLSQKEGLVSGHRPSADVLFQNVDQVYGDKSIGVIMTGMGRDGVTHLKKMRDRGAFTIAQDQESCVVFGMPKIAIQENAADEILSLDGIVLRLRKIAEDFSK